MVLLGAGTAAAAVWLPWVIPLPVLLLAFVLWFFRDPRRGSDASEEAVIAPADGKVVEVSRVEEPEHIGGRALKIAIFMSVFDVHVNRAPCNTMVKWNRHVPGRFLNALKAEAGIENEQQLVALDRDGQPVLLKLVAGLIARRIVCRLKPGDSLRRGERLGMIKFGSRVEVFLPADEKVEVAVRLGQRVRAGETVIGYWR